MSENLYSLQLLTFLVKNFDYQIVNIKFVKTKDYWLINPNKKYPLICITEDLYTQDSVKQSIFAQVYSSIKVAFKKNLDCMIINTNNLSEKFEIDNILQIPINDHFPLDELLICEFEGIENNVKKVDNKKKEQRNLINQLRKMDRVNTPITSIFSLICIIFFFACELLTSISNNDITSSIILGSYYKINVVGAHEYWRLLTSGFIHIEFFHLLMNLISFSLIGSALEKQMKKSHYVITILLSIIIGNLFVLIGDSNTVGVGISGGLYGLLGVYTVYIYTSGAYKNKQVLQSFVYMISMNIFISMMPNISFLAHFGGYLCGLVLGILFSQNQSLKKLKKHVLISALAIVIGCIAWIPNVTRITPIYGGTDAMVIYTLREMKLDGYADYLLNRYEAHLDKQGDHGYKVFINELVEDLKEEYNEAK